MKFKKLILSLTLFSIILISGCAHRIKPTDICRYDIPVSQLYPKEDFDYIDFFDMSIEVAKESRFQPPMIYDKKDKFLVFGNEEVDKMPGLKMVVYMWRDKSSEDVCMNYQIIDVKGSPLTDGTARVAISNFKDELEQKYHERLESTKRIYEKYQTN